MLPTPRRIIIASVLAIASFMLLLVGSYAQSRARKAVPPAAIKATFDAKGVPSCPAGYVYDPGFPPASACRIEVLKGVKGACPLGYKRRAEGECALESVQANNKNAAAIVAGLGFGAAAVGSRFVDLSICPVAFPIYDKSSNRCIVCFQPPKDPSKKCQSPDLNGNCEPKKCG